MKIAVIGYSGSGKSTLAGFLGEHYRAEVLHLDAVHFLPGWIERRTAEEQRIVADFLDHNDRWVIDGNYTKLSYDRRMAEADLIIMMLFGRFDCLARVIRRYRIYQDKTRPDMAEGCNEKMDREFISWVLWKGRSKAARQRYRKLQQRYADKVVVLKNQRQLDRYIEEVSSGGMTHV